MFEVFAYKDRNGKSPIADYIQGLAVKSDKDSRIKLNKIYEYTKCLSEEGSRAREPYAKHLEARYGSCVRFVTGFYTPDGTARVLYCYTIS